MDALVDTEWLAGVLGAPDLRVVDGSWYMPAEGRDARAEFARRHIPGAVYFDIDEIADRANPLPHMLPPADQFAAQVGALGIGDGDRVVVYDGIGLFSAPRVWWMLRVFGHDQVAVLDGGLPKWLAEGRPVAAGEATPTPRPFTARPRAGLVRLVDAIRANIESGTEQVLDARAAGRFDATEPEPRPGLRGGHIPGSHNLPFTDLIDPKTKSLRPLDEVLARVRAAGIDPAGPIATTCGSGVSAATLALALHRLGNDRVAVYDGSWTEWGGRTDTPIEP